MSVHKLPCPTCAWPNRETVDMVCQTCGTDYGTPTDSVGGRAPGDAPRIVGTGARFVAVPPTGTTTAHVIPVDDLVEHDVGEDRACGPTPESVKQDDGSVVWVVTHHSLDGRERGER